ncbi:hypothetical protein EYF80_041868 [Liparis tanakae]|uniref:Uncharacterized protein n=1 Tax=Liparis tanakae TaxID=230148 RepID=A0A4Z2G4C4_9TELE|nr:hypothetical protein EYF80_041868 [Liparis tanakae]
MSPPQAAARLALEKNVLMRKHCMMVAVANAPRLLLVHHAFDDHGHRVDPGQRHEERQRAVQHPEEPAVMGTNRVFVSAAGDSHVVHVAGVRHLLDVDAGWLLDSGQHAAHRSLHQVLDVHEAAPDVAHVVKRVGCRTGIPKPEEKTKELETVLKTSSGSRDVRRQPGGRGVGQQEHHAGPELPVLQQLQSPVHQVTLALQPLQLVQGETLQRTMEDRI